MCSSRHANTWTPNPSKHLSQRTNDTFARVVFALAMILMQTGQKPDLFRDIVDGMEAEAGGGFHQGMRADYHVHQPST